jgi:Tfp pilus assembly protein PilN
VSALPSSVGAPALPQVSLIPPEFARRSRQTQLRGVALIIVLVPIGLVIAWWFFAVGVKTVAESGLAAEQHKRPDLAAELATYSYVSDAQRAHESAIAAEEWATSTDVRWDAYVAQMEQALPPGVFITKIEVLQASPVGALRANIEGPFDEADLGTIAITAQADQPQLANDYVAALASISGLYHVEIYEMQIDTRPDSDLPVWRFVLHLDIGLEALSGRSIVADGGAQ